MGLLATIRGTTADTGVNAIYTFSSGDTTNLDLRTRLISTGTIKNNRTTKHIKVIIPVGVTIGSSNTSYPVLNITNFNSNEILTVINNGNIYGAGGAAGSAGSAGCCGGACGCVCQYATPGTNGSNGGNALYITSRCTIINNGYIYSGGGGGGGSGGTYGTSCGGCGGQNCCACAFCPGVHGSYQCFYHGEYPGGAGGVGQGYGQPTGGGAGGGAGGTYGVGGFAGGAGYSGVTSSGGVPGYYISGINNVAFVNNGSVLGSVQ